MAKSRLDEIVENKKLEVEQRKKSCSASDVASRALARLASKLFLKAISQCDKLNLIAEIKPKSPSAGVLRSEVSLDDVLDAYDAYASAISVLTDEKYFGGSLSLLEQVSHQSKLPTLCKDFIIDPHQCYEARLAGAQALLLIVKILQPEQLAHLHETAEELGMSAVVEVQTEAEMATALRVNPSILLVNNRNLTTFEVDLSTTEKLAAMVPKSATLISASGIEERSDIERLSKHCNSFLIGSSLMRASDIKAKLRELSAQAKVPTEN